MKAIFFDFGGTLDSNGIHWQDRFYPLYIRAGADIPRELFTKAFYDADDHLHVKHKLAEASFEETILYQVRDVLGFLNISKKGIAETIRDGFVGVSRRAFALNRPLLENLGKKFKLGIISNFYGNLESVLKSEGMLDLFYAVIDSGRAGFSKPHPGIFKSAMDAVKTDPPESLMVGDSLSRDMLGAEAAGMPHAWLYGDRFAGGEPSPCCGRCIILRNLKELPDKIK